MKWWLHAPVIYCMCYEFLVVWWLIVVMSQQPLKVAQSWNNAGPPPTVIMAQYWASIRLTCVLLLAFCLIFTGWSLFSEDLAMMLGSKPGRYFHFLWCFLTPLIIFVSNLYFVQTVPSKHVTFTRCCFNVGPAWDSVEDGGLTLKQHWVNLLSLLDITSLRKLN